MTVLANIIVGLVIAFPALSGIRSVVRQNRVQQLWLLHAVRGKQ
jgi:hypothetical protein